MIDLLVYRDISSIFYSFSFNESDDEYAKDYRTRYVYRSMLLLLTPIVRFLEEKKMGEQKHRGRKSQEAHRETGCPWMPLAIFIDRSIR